MQSTEQIAQSIEFNMNKIAFFGTSHTHGQCNDLPEDRVVKPWTNCLADSFNAECLNFGLMGATNFELQVLVNEAIGLGYLEDVDTVVMEPRLSFDDLTVKNKFNNGSFNNTQDNLGKLIGFTRQYIDIGEPPWHYSINRTLGLGDFKDLKGFNQKYFNSDIVTTEQRLERSELEKLVNLHALFVEHNTLMVYKNLEFMNTMKNLFNSLDKKFYWINWECGIKINSKTFPLHSTIIQYCLNSDISIKDYMINMHNKKYLCSCSHWNEEAQPLIGEFISKRLKLK